MTAVRGLLERGVVLHPSEARNCMNAMKQQHTLMKFDPATGAENPYPSHAEQWRKYRGAEAWLFNPWSGTRRLASDVGTDVFGLLVLPPGEPMYAMPRARPLSDELMDCVDRLGSECGSVDPRVWDHLLVYAPNERVAQRAAAIAA